MILEVQGIPAIVVEHECLPLVDDVLQRLHLPRSGRKLSVFTNIHIHAVKKVSESCVESLDLTLTFRSGKSYSIRHD